MVYLVCMAATVRTARLFLLVAFVTGWTGSVLGVPAVLAFGLHGHVHEVRMTATDGHVDAVLHHDDTGVEGVHDETLPAGVPVHSDHTVHLPNMAAVAVVKVVPAPAHVAVQTPTWTLPPRSSAVRPVLSVPVPDGPRAALRSTVLLV